MSAVSIHQTAIVEKDVDLGKNVIIGPYAIVGSGVALEDNVEIKSHAIISGQTSIGKNLDELVSDFPFQRNRFSKYCNAVEKVIFKY